jgi:uncharacterized protein (TIGR02271 family)
MALYKIKDYDPNYRDYLGNDDILGFDVYSGDDKVGSVEDLIVDNDGNFRYLVLNTGVWIFGKKVLLPIGRARLAYADHRVYVDGMTRQQVENLPEYAENMTLDYDYEERVRNVYRPSVETSATLLNSETTIRDATVPQGDRPAYNYTQEPDLYHLNDQNHLNLKLYQERLIANKTRQKTGEVTVGKRVETETARVDVPLEKERIVIERVASSGSDVAVAPGEVAFQSGEVSRMEVYEEVADIHKEAFVREEVSIRKEVDRETATAEERLRREELDVQTEGRPVVNSDVNSVTSDPL